MAWLSGWGKRIEITISNTNVDSNLTHFPLPLIINDGAGTGSADIATPVFTELGAEDLKIAVTESDGTSELYVEVEQWSYDSGTVADSEAILWVSKSDFVISSSANTTVYLYYDSSHADNSSKVGVVGSTPGEAVWDGSFEMVQHMNSASNAQLVDSTENDIDSSTNTLDTSAGKLGLGMDDDESEYANFGDAVDLGSGDFLVECWVKPSATCAGRAVQKRGTGAAGAAAGWIVYIQDVADAGTAYLRNSIVDDGSGDYVLFDDGTAVEIGAVGNWHHVVLQRDGTTVNVYVAGALAGTGSDAGLGSVDNALSLTIGASASGTPGTLSQYFLGQTDEVRISSSKRTASWIKANYYAQDDNLISWGSEGESLYGICAMSSTSSISNAATVLAAAAADMDSSSTLVSSATIAATGQAIMASIAQMAAAGNMALSGSVSMQSVSSMLAVSSTIILAEAALESVSSMVAACNLAASGAADLESISSATMAGNLTAAATAALESVSAMASAATAALSGAVDMDSSSSMAALAVIVRTASAALESVASLVASGNVSASGVVSMESVSSLSATAKLLASAAAALESVSSMGATGSSILSAIVAMASISAMTATPIRVRHGVVSMTTSSAMAVTAIKYICQWFDYAGTLSDGDVLEIDTDKMTVKLNDVDMRYNLSGRKKFFKLTVGDQQIQYADGESSRTADVDVTHSPRWS